MTSDLDNKTLFFKLFWLTKPFHKTISKMIAVIAIIATVEALVSYFLSKVFNLAAKNFDIKTLLFWCGLAICFIAARIFFIGLKDRINISEYQSKIESYLDKKSIEKFLNFSNGQHINEHSGVKQSVVVSGINSIRDQSSTIVYWLVSVAANLIASIIIILSINKYLGFFYMIGAVVLAKLLSNFHSNFKPGVETLRDLRENLTKIKSDLYRHTVLVKNEVAENNVLNELTTAYSIFFEAEKTTWLNVISKISIIRLVAHSIKWSSIIISIFLLKNGALNVGHIFLLFFWSDKFIEAVWVLCDGQKQFMVDKANIEKYFKFLDQNCDLKYSDNPIKDNLIGNIEFKDVTFSYPNREKEADKKQLLQQVSFKIKMGEKIGIVGESGSGKSTVANLIRRSFDPESGDIFINGNNLKDIEIKLLLKQIGSVEQDVVLFDKTIRENVSFGLDSLLTDEQMETVAQQSGIYKFFCKLEKGWDTKVGESGCKLSGGEKQRIGIARALAKKPQILIFDEATSALDLISEKQVQEAIDQSCDGKTAIIIAHRLSTVKNCDRILVMKDGKLLAADKHDILIETCEYYQDLVKTQTM